MTNIKSSFVRRISLCPPHERSDSPNASMVDGSSVMKSITRHIRQRDQETANEQEQQNQLAQQRLSLATAVQIVTKWHKRNLTDDSTSEIHEFNTNITKKDDQIKK